MGPVVAWDEGMMAPPREGPLLAPFGLLWMVAFVNYSERSQASIRAAVAVDAAGVWPG